MANYLTRSNTAFGVEAPGLAASCGLEPLEVFGELTGAAPNTAG